MRGRKSKEIEYDKKGNDETDDDFKILAEAIHPRKLTKELKDSIIEALTTRQKVTFFID